MGIKLRRRGYVIKRSSAKWVGVRRGSNRVYGGTLCVNRSTPVHVIQLTTTTLTYRPEFTVRRHRESVKAEPSDFLFVTLCRIFSPRLNTTDFRIGFRASILNWMEQRLLTIFCVRIQDLWCAGGTGGGNAAASCHTRCRYKHLAAYSLWTEPRDPSAGSTLYPNKKRNPCLERRSAPFLRF